MSDELTGQQGSGSFPDDDGRVAERLGVSAERVEPFFQSLRNRTKKGGDQMAALMETAEEHGIPGDRLRRIFQDYGKENTENPAEDLAELLARELFGGHR